MPFIYEQMCVSLIIRFINFHITFMLIENAMISSFILQILADLFELFDCSVVVISPRSLGWCLVSKCVCSDLKRQNWKSWLYLFTYWNDHQSAGICWEEKSMTHDLKIFWHFLFGEGLHVSWRRLCKSKKAFALRCLIETYVHVKKEGECL